MDNLEGFYENTPETVKKALESVTGVQELPPKNSKLIDYKASLSKEQFLWLFLHGEQKDWQYYSNFGSMTKVRVIDDLLEEIYASFENTEYRSDKDGLTEEQGILYDYIAYRFLENTASTINRNEARGMGILDS